MDRLAALVAPAALPTLFPTLLLATLALGVYALLRHLADLCAEHDRPVAQALGRLATLPGTYLHELAHAAASIVLTGRGRVRLHAVRRAASGRADGQIALGSADVWYRGPRSNALVSAAPALVWWPLAAWAAWQGLALASPAAAALAGLLAFAGRLSDSDLEQVRRG